MAKMTENPQPSDQRDSREQTGQSEQSIKTNQSKTRKTSKADVFKFAGLIAFFIIMALLVAAMWPHISIIFEPGGLEILMERVRDAGWQGVFILEAIQFLQIVVAFIPGEVVQVAAGAIYGPWWGAVVVLVGCILSSAFVFMLVHKLGAPFVHDMVPEKYMDKFRKFENSGKFNIVIFILFLIPGMPKDIFTYITPLSDMKLLPFLLITNSARIPGIVVSTYAADGLMEGRIWESVVIFLVLAVIAGLALLFSNRIVDGLHRLTKR